MTKCENPLEIKAAVDIDEAKVWADANAYVWAVFNSLPRGDRAMFAQKLEVEAKIMVAQCDEITITKMTFH